MIVAIAQLAVAAVVAAATIVLAIATWRYAVSAAETVKAMREQQIASMRPVLVVAGRPEDWVVVNVGKGPAVNGLYRCDPPQAIRELHHAWGGPGAGGPLGARQSAQPCRGFQGSFHGS